MNRDFIEALRLALGLSPLYSPDGTPDDRIRTGRAQERDRGAIVDEEQARFAGRLMWHAGDGNRRVEPRSL